MSFISLIDTNQSSTLSLTKMNENKLIITIILLYLIVNFLIHMIFFLTTIFNHKWHIWNKSRHFFYRYFQQTSTNNMNSVNPPSIDLDQSSSNNKQIEPLKSLISKKISSSTSSLSSDIIHESETILIRTIHSFGLFLCTCLLITNWLCLVIYIFPIFYPNIFQFSSNLCIIQSFFLHVLTLFHLNVTICIRLFWHYCFLVNKYWQTITYCRLFNIFLCIFFSLCLLTWPSISNEWASIIFDHTLNICTVNYTFHLSYTFFILSFTCLIPFLLLIFSHYKQMKCIQRRIKKYFLTFKNQKSKENFNIIHQNKQFQYASYMILIWSFINIILLIGIHIPIENGLLIKSIIYYIQMFVFLIDPILYIFIFRSLSIITLLRPTNELSF